MEEGRREGGERQIDRQDRDKQRQKQRETETESLSVVFSVV